MKDVSETSSDVKSIKKKKKKAQVLNILKKITQKQRDNTPESKEQE
jgi:hypothetical protein